MATRRQFLARGSLAALAAAGTCFALPGDDRDDDEGRSAIPDGSASHGMMTRQADQAIESGLSYLRRNQHEDGSFGTGSHHGNVAITSLAGLAFMAHGDVPDRGADGRLVTRALQYVLDHERRDIPGFLNNPIASPHGPMYDHGFATLFVAECVGMVHGKELRERLNLALHRAVRLILNGQNIEGGWRYNPGDPDADISVTICQIMALRAARNAGVAVPRAQVDKCVEYVKNCQNMPEGSFRYMKQQPGGGGPQAFARTAAGVCALYSAGIYHGPEVEAGLRFLSHPTNRPLPHYGGRLDMHYFYGYYYAVQAMWTAGGDYWRNWYPSIRDQLISTQSQAADGSWTDHTGSHYATAMACIILQVPNNYLPILQK